jgi:surface antigen
MKRTLHASIAALIACSLPAIAANIDKDIPLGNFTEQDMKDFRQALDFALEKNADGDSLHWASMKTKASGDIKPLKSFERGGLKCRTANVANEANGRTASGPFTFCKNKDGKWVLAEPPK